MQKNGKAVLREMEKLHLYSVKIELLIKVNRENVIISNCLSSAKV